MQRGIKRQSILILDTARSKRNTILILIPGLFQSYGFFLISPFAYSNNRLS